MGRTRDGGIQIGLDVLHDNRLVAHVRSYAAELVFSTFGPVEIPKVNDHSPDFAKAFKSEAIKREAQTALGMLANCVGDTKAFGTNLN
jgi:hypothetical protein